MAWAWTPADVVLGPVASAGRSGVVRIDGEALPPITQGPTRIAIEDRREIENLTGARTRRSCGIDGEPGVANGLPTERWAEERDLRTP